MADGGSGSGSDAPGDYSNFGWKDVMKAVTGQDPDNPASDATAVLISDPNTIQAAADTFYYTEQLLQETVTKLGEQVDALTGPDGPWQGMAAQALNSVMTTLTTQTKAMADTLSGGVTGDDNIPQQLANNAQNLRDATNKLYDIDDFYAKQAVATNSDALMDNGRIAISIVPGLSDMMAADMRQVLVQLQGFYHLTAESVAQPTPPTSPTTGPGGSPDPYYQPTGPAEPIDYLGPNYVNPDLGDLNNPYGQTLDPNAVNSPNLTPFTGGTNLDNGPAFPTNGTLSPFTGGTNLGDGPALSTNRTLSPYSDGTTLGDGPAFPTSSTLNPYMDKTLSPGTGLNDLTTFPGLKLGADTKDSTDTSKSRGTTSFPDSLSLDDPVGGSSLTSPGLDLPGYTGLNSPDLNTSGVSGPDLGTSQGLSDYPNATLGSGQAGPSTGSVGSAGSGMPMMPMGGMGSGGAPAGGSGAPSDASGLLQGDAAPWQGSPLLDGSTDASGGAAPGGAGLNLPTGDGSSAGTSGPGSEQAASATPMMPMMPMGGMGAGAGGSGGEGGASDASGLLEGSNEPWAVTPVANGAGVGSTEGTPHGDGQLLLSDESGAVASAQAGGTDIFASPSAASPSALTPSTSSGPSAEAAATGLLAGLPFLAAGAWSAAGAAGGADGPRTERAEAWREPTREGAEGVSPAAIGGSAASAASGGSESHVQAPPPGPTAVRTSEAAPEAVAYPAHGTVRAPTSAPMSEPTSAPASEASAIGSDGLPVHAPAQEPVSGPTSRPVRPPEPEVQTAAAPTAVPATDPVAAPATDPVASAVAAEGPAVDDTSAWDAPEASLLHLLGHPADVGAGHGADSAQLGEEVAAVTGVAGAAYMVGRISAADQAQAFEEPARPAWRPKPPGPGSVVRREFTCSAEPLPAKPEQPDAEATPDAAKARSGEGDDAGKSSVADLLRQSDAIWGAGSANSGAVG